MRLYLLALFLLSTHQDLIAEPFYKTSAKTYDSNALSLATQQNIYEIKKAQYNQLLQVAEEAFLQEHFKILADQKKVSIDEIEKQEIKIPAVSDKTIANWFEANKARLGGRALEPLKLEIKAHLERQGQFEAKKTYVEKLKKDKNFSFLLEEPKAQKVEIVGTENFPSKGASNPKLTIVEFADYTCPHCKSASASLQKIVKEYKDQIKLVYMDFPLQKDGLSTLIAQGAHCAKNQDRFWEYHYKAFENQAELNPLWPEKMAKDLKMDEKKFKDCLKDNSLRAKVESSRVEGERLGVMGTPAIYLNGYKLDSYEINDLESAVKKALKKG